MLVTTLVYCLAGIAKLRGVGLHWLSGDVMQHHIAFNSVRKAELGTAPATISTWLVTYGWAFAPIAWATLALELSGPVMLLDRRARQCWAVALLAFHWGIAWIMGISFVYPMWGMPFLAFLRAERLSFAARGVASRLLGQPRSATP